VATKKKKKYVPTTDRINASPPRFSQAPTLEKKAREFARIRGKRHSPGQRAHHRPPPPPEQGWPLPALTILCLRLAHRNASARSARWPSAWHFGIGLACAATQLFHHALPRTCGSRWKGKPPIGLHRERHHPPIIAKSASRAAPALFSICLGARFRAVDGKVAMNRACNRRLESARAPFLIAPDETTFAICVGPRAPRAPAWIPHAYWRTLNQMGAKF